MTMHPLLADASCDTLEALLDAVSGLEAAQAARVRAAVDADNRARAGATVLGTFHTADHRALRYVKNYSGVVRSDKQLVIARVAPELLAAAFQRGDSAAAATKRLREAGAMPHVRGINRDGYVAFHAPGATADAPATIARVTELVDGVLRAAGCRAPVGDLTVYVEDAAHANIAAALLVDPDDAPTVAAFVDELEADEVGLTTNDEQDYSDDDYRELEHLRFLREEAFGGAVKRAIEHRKAAVAAARPQ